MPNSVVSHDANDYRVVVFGAAGVGKSSIVRQFVQGTYQENYIPTVEDTYRKVRSHAMCVRAALILGNVYIKY